jgi:hypothetical protein
MSIEMEARDHLLSFLNLPLICMTATLLQDLKETRRSILVVFGCEKLESRLCVSVLYTPHDITY